MPRNYDIVKTPQDLTYLEWDERGRPSGAQGSRLKAREGTGAHAVLYKLPRDPAMPGEVNRDLLCELLSCRVMRLLGIEHVPVTLVRAQISLNGRTELTWLLRTMNYRNPSQQKASLEQIHGTFAQPGEGTWEFCLRNGWQDQLSGMFLADYLCANRSRTGRQIEVLRTADGTMRPAPILPSSRCLVSSFRMQTWRKNALESVRANNYLGESSCLQNLQLMSPAFTCRELSASDRTAFRGGLTDIADHVQLNGSWTIVWKRWQAYCELRKNRGL
ncbi:MAG: hypothetical protein Q4D06_02890 [Coriobacteriia bacterium]|nr:hypothetical protein [Coriobacteriia bacterium]